MPRARPPSRAPVSGAFRSAGEPGAIDVIDRRIVTVMDHEMKGAKQPYHHVEAMELHAAEKHLAKCAAIADRMALEAVGGLVRELTNRGYQTVGAAVLLASGRPLPDLAKILASHALIHTAEGEFFRDIFRRACDGRGIAVTAMRERDVDEAPALRRPAGPPCTQAQKLAGFA